MTDIPLAAQPLSYATAAAFPKPPRLAAAVWLSLIGLGLIGFGGCFMIGIMETLWPHVFLSGGTPAPMTPGIVTFLIVMYILAFGCFGAAIALLLAGVRSLFKLMNS